MRIGMKSYLGCALVVAAVIGGTATLEATVIEPMSDADLVREAGFIVHGRVTGAVSRWNEGQSQIFTFVDIAVDNQLKGESLGKVVSLRLLGGYADGIGMAIAGAPAFQAGEEVVVLMEGNPHAILPVVGMSHGKFTVLTDAETGVKTVKERGVEFAAFMGRLSALAHGRAAGRDLGPLPKPVGTGAIAGQNPACPNPAIDCCTGAGPGGVGCFDNNCCNEVCDLDPFCCNVAWDAICTGEAQTECPELCAPVPAPPDDSTAYQFRLAGVGGTANPTVGPPLAPHAAPPFMHFDLREFPECEIPYSFHNGTAEIPGLVEFDAVDAAFVTWKAVTPAIIQFVRVLPGPGAACPLVKDKHTMIGWDSFNCATVGDDTCLAPAAGNDDVAVIALVCGGTCVAGETLITGGPDNTLQAAANNCLGVFCAGDDVEDNVPVPPVIKDGGNARIESVLVDRGCVCHYRLGAVSDLVGPGPDGWLTTEPNNCCDDYIKTDVRMGQTFFGIWDGGNGIRETLAVPPDTNVGDQSAVPDFVDHYCRCLPGQLLVKFTSQANTAPNNCCDDTLVNVAPPNQAPVYRIRDGGDLRVTTSPSIGLGKGTLALTANFYEGPREGGPNSGRILESDILFNDADYMWQILANAAAMGGSPDVQSVAVHEIGHFIGLHHANDIGVSNPDPILNPGGVPIVMNPSLDTFGKSKQNLHPGDEDGINFQYTPDLGDAPDPVAAVFNEYQTKVHSATINPGRTLNGVQLFKPASGPVHLFGHGGAPRFEWLGGDEDGHADECEARVPDMDEHDDGVTLVNSDGNEVARLTRGADNYFKVVISHTGVPGRYLNAANPRRRLYVNGYLDLDDNDVFDTGDPGPSDLEMWWAGIPDPCTTFNSTALDGAAVCDNAADPKTITLKFKVAIPAGAPDTVYARFRLDWGEDLGYVAGLPDGVSGDLLDGEGTAQFGEVEDYAFDANDGGGNCPWDCGAPNGIVDTVDFLALLQVWGLSGGNGPCDFDNNGIVDTVDFLALLQHWGPCG